MNFKAILSKSWGFIKPKLQTTWKFYRAKGQPWYKKALSWTLLFFTTILLYITLVEINFLWLFGYSPSVFDINNPDQNIASEIYAANGKLLGKFFIENRSPVEYKDLSPMLIKTLVATEDSRFYEHHGIDFEALSSVLADAVSGHPRGGSTITQQLVKNLFKTRKSNHGLFGKIPFLKIFIIKSKEWINAVKIELFFSKEKILTSYFNTVDFGSNSFGIKTAAKTFFNTTPKNLKPEQCAMLVGMLKAPSGYSPIYKKDRAFKRRNVVLGIMLRDKIISQQQHDELIKKTIVLDYNVENVYDGIANYFRRSVYEYLKPWLKENDLDIYSSGLKIYTTLDYQMQIYAEEAVLQNMKRVQRQFDGHWQGMNPWVDGNNKEIPNFIETVVKNSWYYSRLKHDFNGNKDSINYYLNKKEKINLFSWKGSIDTSMSFIEATKYLKRILHAGFLVMDPHSGAIKAYVGGIDFNHFKYDNVRSMRQPGSTFKAFVYTAAMDNGYAPCDSLPDIPITVNYVEKGVAKSWAPHNSDFKNAGHNVSLKYAFAHSLNTISVQLTQRLGTEKIINYAHRMGIKSPLDTVPSICLGSSDVTLLELTTAYCPLVNGGYRIEPMFVTRIEDSEGNVIKEFKVEKQKVLSDETVFLMQQQLLGSLSEPYGTTQALFSYDLFKYKTDFGGKTGTSSNHSDGWFIGVTPKLIGGSWVGAEERCVHFRSSALGEGCKTALPIFGLFMEKVMKDHNYDTLHALFPRHFKGMKRPYTCHTKYVPRDTVDTTMAPIDTSIINQIVLPRNEEETPVEK